MAYLFKKGIDDARRRWKMVDHLERHARYEERAMWFFAKLSPSCLLPRQIAQQQAQRQEQDQPQPPA